MIIRILPRLGNRQEWIDFCSRERSYCYVEQPDTLVDFQTNHLIITLLNQSVRNGKQAVKFSIGSRHSIEPAWNFIKGCHFDLDFMVQGLQSVNFDSNARDNHLLGFSPEANVRKFFSKEQSIISPNSLGTLDPLNQLPAHWSLGAMLNVLANGQFTDLRSEQAHLNTEPDPEAPPIHLLLKLLEEPDKWQVRVRNQRLWLLRNGVPQYSLLPKLHSETANNPALPRFNQA